MDNCTKYEEISLLNASGHGSHQRWGLELHLIDEVWPLSDSREDEEHPEVNAEHQNHLENTLSQQGLLQVEGPVYYHGTKLDEQHNQEGLWNLILRQWLCDVDCCRVFLQRVKDQQVWMHIVM